MNIDHLSVCTWSHKTQGVSRFIEVGEGFSRGEDDELQDIHSPMNSSNELEDQPVGSNIEEEEKSTEEKEHPTGVEKPTTYTATVSGWVTKPPACLIKEIGEATLSVAE